MNKTDPKDRQAWSRLVGSQRVPWMRKLEDNPAVPDCRAQYSPDPIELDADGKPVGKAELYQRMIHALADANCTGLRATELQRIWTRRPGYGLRSWGHIVAEARAQRASQPKPAHWYTFTIERSDSESYAVVWRQWPEEDKPREYLCTVYIPAPIGQTPEKATAVAGKIVEALNRMDGTHPPGSS